VTKEDVGMRKVRGRTDEVEVININCVNTFAMYSLME